MEILLPIHILAGITSLLCAALAVSSEKGKKLHVLSGRTYFLGMVGASNSSDNSSYFLVEF